MKNIKKFIFVLVLGIVGVVLFSCTLTENQNVFKESKDVIAFQAISSVELLASFEDAKPVVGPVSDLAEETAVEEELDILNHYLGIMEKYLGNNNGLTITEEVSEMEGYSKLMVIKTVDMTGAKLEYHLYYNEILITDEEEDLEEDLDVDLDEEDEEKIDGEEEKDEEEVEYLIEGILIVNGIEYTVEGSREFEEDEETLMLTAKIDDDNFVAIHYEIEDDERVFNYFVKKDGVISRTKVEVEEEDDKIEVELTFVEGTAKGKYKFEMSKDDDGTEIIKIKYVLKQEDETIEKGHIRIYITIDEETGEAIYDYKIYSENNEFKGKRQMNRKGHHGEVPEDFKGGKNSGKNNENSNGKKNGNNKGNNNEDNNGINNRNNNSSNTGKKGKKF